MKKILYLMVAAILLTAVIAFAGGPVSIGSYVFEGFAPDGRAAAQITTRNSRTYNMTDYFQFSIFTNNTTGKVRFMTYSTTKAGTVKEPIVAGSWNTFLKNPNTVYVNISGMTGNLRRQ